MSDSGGTLGDCIHLRGGDRRECVECLNADLKAAREEIGLLERLIAEGRSFLIGKFHIYRIAGSREQWFFDNEVRSHGPFDTPIAALRAVEKGKGVGP